MSTLAIVFLGILGGLFIAILLGLAAALILLYIRSKKILLDFQQSLRADIATISLKLESQQQSVIAAVQKINGEELSAAAGAILKAAQSNVQSAKRIENAALVIGQLTIPEEVQRAHGLAPNEYAAADGEPFISLNNTAKLDQEAQAEEG